MHKITNVIGIRQPRAQIRINILIHLSNMGTNIDNYFYKNNREIIFFFLVIFRREVNNHSLTGMIFSAKMTKNLLK